ncbi:hypothetical protein AB0L41_11805 [Amycolatopsis mediterranei]|uniref:hypothetical protein n=1 Tax=Amycolatopsis mediterranei TaxID=33910 RepID=UPI0034354BB8
MPGLPRPTFEWWGGGYPPGRQVRYRGRRPAAGLRQSRERIGTTVGPSLRAEHTGTTWVPVRLFCTAELPRAGSGNQSTNAPMRRQDGDIVW